MDKNNDLLSIYPPCGYTSAWWRENWIIVHDCWGSYWKYQEVTHAICCAHLLRELNGVIENHPEQTWASRFKKLLLDMRKIHFLKHLLKSAVARKRVNYYI